MAKSDIRIVIADDHSIFRHGLSQVIEKEPDLTILAEAKDGETAAAALKTFRPDVAVLDIDMPGMDGFAVARLVSKDRLPVQIVFLTMYKDELHLSDALDLGAKGYILKEAAAAEVVNCIRAVHRGETHVSPSLSIHLLNRARRASEFVRDQPQLESLTPAERRILSLLADCKTSKDIATDLGISTRTVENHRANICEKLNLHGPHSLVRFALQHKTSL